MMTILVYHTGALGDFVTVLPVFAALRAHRPGARLVLLGRRAHGELAQAAGLLDELWDIDGAEFTSLFADRPADRLMRRLETIECALVFASTHSPVITALEKAGVGTIRTQPPFPAHRQHVVDYHLSLLESLGVDRPEAVAAIELPPVDREEPPAGCAAVNRSTVIIHPGSGSSRKNWPLEHFIELADRIASSGRTVLWVRGPAERTLTLPPQAAIVDPSDPSALARLLCRAGLYIGNDSGVSHLAAACRCPTVVLFGPSDPAVWAPRGRHVHLIDAAPPCRPCHPGDTARAGTCRKPCLHTLGVAHVWEVVAEALGSVHTSR
jgi:ADP-heptose:LPS heptosyltransferase